jgi:hypothetical protein
MSKARFGRILQNLLFSNNTDERAGTGRAWKVRPVVEKLQQTFGAGCNVPPVLAFDEAVIPSQRDETESEGQAPKVGYQTVHDVLCILEA